MTKPRRYSLMRSISAGAMAALALVMLADLISGYRLLPTRPATGASITQSLPD